MKEKSHNYHTLLEKYNGAAFSDIPSDDLRILKKGLKLPASKQLYYRHKCNKPVREIVIDGIYKPSYMCRLAVTTEDGQQYRVLSEYFVEMQRKKK